MRLECHPRPAPHSAFRIPQSSHAAACTGSATTFAAVGAAFGVRFAALARFFLALAGFTGIGPLGPVPLAPFTHHLVYSPFRACAGPRAGYISLADAAPTEQ